MTAIKRFYLCEFIGEQLADTEAAVMVIEQSLGDGHDEEMRAYGNVLERLLEARRWLKIAQGEAEQERQRELVTQHLQASVAKFKSEKIRCAEIGEGR